MANVNHRLEAEKLLKGAGGVLPHDEDPYLYALLALCHVLIALVESLERNERNAEMDRKLGDFKSQRSGTY